MKLRCIRNGILFVFLQQVTGHGLFVDKTKWGFEIIPGSYLHGKDRAQFDKALNTGHWGRVLTIGPDCKEINVGDYICVEPQMWSNAFDHEGFQIRKTDESKVMLISKDKPDTRI